MKYKCKICGKIYDEEEEGIPLSNISHCPLCKQPTSNFIPIKENDEYSGFEIPKRELKSLAYAEEYGKPSNDSRYMNIIHDIAVHGKSIVEAMDTQLKMPNWDDVMILGCQLNPKPLESDIEVTTKTVIGKTAKKPLILETPIYISHMSYGALSKEVKTSLSKGSALAKTAIASGEGGILDEEFNNAYRYIFEYIPNLYSVNSENLKKVDAIDIKIGQATKPGLGGQLEGEKVTDEIAKVRGKPVGEAIHSPATFNDINSSEDLKNLVRKLRKESDGRPIGIKLAAGRLEEDLEYILESKADYVTIDGRGGSTGASPKLIKDSTSIPTIYALYRARKFLDDYESDISLVITGGLRVSSDFAKALAMGADAVAVGTGALIAAGCQQYRICETGNCPVGIATQNEDLRKRFEVDPSTIRVYNYLNQSTEELRTFARITGHSDVHDLNVEDLATFNSEISNYTNIKHF